MVLRDLKDWFKDWFALFFIGFWLLGLPIAGMLSETRNRIEINESHFQEQIRQERIALEQLKAEEVRSGPEYELLKEVAAKYHCPVPALYLSSAPDFFNAAYLGGSVMRGRSGMIVISRDILKFTGTEEKRGLIAHEMDHLAQEREEVSAGLLHRRSAARHSNDEHAENIETDLGAAKHIGTEPVRAMLKCAFEVLPQHIPEGTPDRKNIRDSWEKQMRERLAALDAAEQR
jgi:hypothetical protein